MTSHKYDTLPYSLTHVYSLPFNYYELSPFTYDLHMTERVFVILVEMLTTEFGVVYPLKAILVLMLLCKA